MPPQGSNDDPIRNREDRVAHVKTSRLASSVGLLVLLLALSPGRVGAQAAKAGERPNILWIVSEDNNPYLGCYGDKLARTPTIDSLAKDGVIYENCFSTAPVCAPSRFALITGVFATSCGPALHMRASGKMM